MRSDELQVVADENMPGVEACWQALMPALPVRIRRLPGRQLSATDVADADVLLVRSVTRVDASLLAGSRVRFVGTATIGTDHVDLPYCAAHGITVASAPGCNARAVAEWVLAVIVQLAAERDRSLDGCTLGIVGFGHVGQQVATLMRPLGLRLIACDPAHARELPGFPDVTLHALPDLLAASDIVTLHTPLTRSGPHPTWRMIDDAALGRLRPGAWLINAGRGDAIAGEALRHWLENENGPCVLDVWPEEPRLSPALVAHVRLGTPHVAGHSVEGKWRGTWQVVQAAAAHLGRSAPDGACLSAALPGHDGASPLLPPATAGMSSIRRLAFLLGQVIDLVGDDVRLRDSVLTSDPVQAFDALRKHYAARREFTSWTLTLAPDDPLRDVLIALGFSC